MKSSLAHAQNISGYQSCGMYSKERSFDPNRSRGRGLISGGIRWRSKEIDAWPLEGRKKERRKKEEKKGGNGEMEKGKKGDKGGGIDRGGIGV